MIKLKWQWDQEMRWMWSENEMKVKWKSEKVKAIKYNDLIENVAVNAIICHDYITNMTHMHDLLIYV